MTARRKITLTAILVVIAFCWAVAPACAETASWYSAEACRWNPDPACPTASGRSLYDLERDKVMFAAMWDVPFGTVIRVTNPATGRSVDVTILDRGPARRLNREIDLCQAAFAMIADLRAGILEVKIEKL